MGISVTSPTNDLAVSPFFTDEELTSLALAADPHAPLDPNAVPWHGGSSSPQSLLPDWYMGHAAAVHASKWRRPVILAVVAAFLLIDAAGLCSTYGIISWA